MVFDLMAYLVAQRERVVSRDEVLDAVWCNVTVSDGALTTAVYEARAALGDDASRQAYIRTFRRRGLRFVAPVEASAAPRETARVHPPTVVPFVGRSALLERLARVRAVVENGHGQVVLLEGEAGIGKTSLVQRMVAQSPRLGVASGRCPQRAGAPPFWPWNQVLRSLGGVAPGDLDLAPIALPLDGTGRVAAPDGDMEARFRLFEAVTRQLRSAAAERPLVVVLEDVHWADRGSLLLLEYLGAEIADARLLVLVTFRGEEPDSQAALATTLGELVRHAHCERVVLGGLERDEVDELLATLLDRPPEAGVIDRIVARTDGNPFFVKEVALSIASRPASHEATELERLVPPAVKEALACRLDRLSPSTREALALAAVMGRELRLDVLARVLARDGIVSLAWLDEAVRARVLAEATDGTVRFTHALVQEAISDALGSARRAQLHRRVADALATLTPPDAGPHLIPLAHHASEAVAAGGDAAAAAEHCRRAGDWATTILAHDDAVLHYTRALELAERAGDASPERRGRLLLACGDARTRSGDMLGAQAAFAAAAEAARAARHAELFARAAVGHGGPLAGFVGGLHLDPGVPRRTVALLEEADAMLPPADHPLRARVLAWWARELIEIDTLARRDELSRRALDMARRLDDPILVADVLGARREALWGPENADARVHMTREMIELAERTGSGELAVKGRVWRLVDLLELGEIEAVDAELEPCRRLAESLRQPRYVHAVTMLRGTLALLWGHFEETERLALEALAHERRRTPGLTESLNFLAQMVTLRREQGRLAEIVEFAEAAAVSHRGAALGCALAYIYGELGRLDDARRVYEPFASSGFTGIPRDRMWLTAVTVLAQVAFEIDDRERAAILYEMLKPVAHRNVVIGEGMAAYGPAAFQLGLLAVVLRRLDVAEAHFDFTLAMNRRLRARGYIAQTLRGQAVMLLARDAPGDRAHARAVIAEALATAEALDMRALRERLLVLRRASEK
jgi:tetratricopeptide (TPR) repeat protein